MTYFIVITRYEDVLFNYLEGEYNVPKTVSSGLLKIFLLDWLIGCREGWI
jgi:hypothetical protein